MAPHSQPNAAVANVATDTALAGIVSSSPQGSIAIANNTKAFDFKSVYIGCGLATGEGAASVPIGCVVSVNAFFVNGQQAPEQTFSFAPNSENYAAPILAVLPSSWVGLKNATLGIASSGGQVTATTLQIDNLVHCNVY